jgi:hypothetical protein
VRDAQGVAVATLHDTITALPLTLTSLPVDASQGVALSDLPLVVIGITPIGASSATTVAPAAPYYSSMIEWGDTTPVDQGQVLTTPGGQVEVTGGHTYGGAGTFLVRVTVGSGSAPTLATTSFTINVAATPIMLTGHLSPSSDTGLSNNDGITRDTTPTYEGVSAPMSTIRVFAMPSSGTPIQIGLTQAGLSGAWSAPATVALANGTYDVFGVTTDPSGTTTATTDFGRLVIDTAGPRITGMTVDPRHGLVTVTFQDNLSGLAQASVGSGANYRLSAKRLTPRGRVPHTPLVTSITTVAPAAPSMPQTVTLTLNGGRRLDVGNYLIRVIAGGVSDIAGNALDGAFYGTFPSGSGSSGGDFVAQVTVQRKTTTLPIPVQNGYASPARSRG